MNQLITELLYITIAAILAPLVISLISLPTIYSKVYVTTLVTSPYTANRETIKEYIKTTFALYAPVSFLWSGTFAILTLYYTNPPQQVLNSVLLGMFMTLCLAWAVITRYPHSIRKHINSNAENIPTERRENIIFHGLTIVHLVLLVFVFFAILDFAQF